MMKKTIYTAPHCEVYKADMETGLMDISVYNYNSPTPTDNVSDNEDDPHKEDNGIIWNDAKKHHGFSLWDEW